MKVYLDDERETPIGWTRAFTAQEAIFMLKSGKVEEISLDHDLGTEDTGYDVALWIEEAAFSGQLNRIKWNIHSNNPSGASRIRAALESAEKFWRTRA